MPELLPEVPLTRSPDRMVMLVDPGADTETLAYSSVDRARQRMPRVTGHMASTLAPIYAEDYFGIYFPERAVWFMEQGTNPFTMRNLPRDRAIPMWVDDPDGSERRAQKNPKTRRTLDGRSQTLIFRRVAPDGARKSVMRRGSDGLPRPTTVPRSYPGAPGRIARRVPGQPLTPAGNKPGQIASGNVGVRWRHPGISARSFLNQAIADTAMDEGIELASLYLCDTQSFFELMRT